ncbi:hypothetical protein [Microbacterium sp. CPCC 204701]|uniref:hypothetical protein n=1 Tax=Microbacterium sp. CPCC 204701 TaxID=2493084 RepID=UPI000FDCACE5|nr:hypothetical protein [Microbacterium sp. CPCC 204701]
MTIGTHPALLELFDALAREGGLIDSGPTWVSFLSADAEILATINDGGARVRIRAYLLNNDERVPSDEEVLAWVAAQPRPAAGAVEAFLEEYDDGSERLVPRLVFERPIAGFTVDHIENVIFDYAEAWEGRTIAPERRPAAFETGDPTKLTPRNAWVLIGDDASFPSEDELTEARKDAQFGIFETLWTAPKHGELGDLALVYFVGKRKAACFVARLASRPFWRTDIEVTADHIVNDHQWWVYLTPLVEIEPIPFRKLAAANGGFLVLRGRSGHYAGPAMIEALTLVAARPAQQSELREVAVAPRGLAELPDPTMLTFSDWRRIPNGLLPLEALVSEHVVKPLIRFIGEVERFPRIVPTMKAEYRTRNGVVDFVVCAADIPLLAVEVKLATRRPISTLWADSPDIQQLWRYMDALEVPGLLIDAHGILVVPRCGEDPDLEIVRADATYSDLRALQELLFVEAHEAFGGTGGIPGGALGFPEPAYGGVAAAPALRRIARRG